LDLEAWSPEWLRGSGQRGLEKWQGDAVSAAADLNKDGISLNLKLFLYSLFLFLFNQIKF
jgi:hypothetical protein